MWSVLMCLTLAAQAKDDDWEKLESPHLKNIRQVPRAFVRADDAQFSPDQKHIIFQAEDAGDNPFYQMFVMELESGKFRRVSPGVGKTTCAYFHPTEKKIIFASTHGDPDAKKHYEKELKEREEEK